MNVLGFSGLNNSVPFKTRAFPDLDKKYRRICQGFDAAAALLCGDQTPVAAAEERFVRRKAIGDFPVNAIQYCLDTAGIDATALDAVAHGFDYRPYESEYLRSPETAEQYKEVYARQAQLDLLNERFPSVKDWDERFVQVPHHLAHAASTFYPSGFSDALIVVADGMGEHEGLTVATGDGHEIEILKQIPSINSLGIFYSVFTMYLGFEFNMDEYKVMGLAPYGKPRRYFNKIMSLITLHDDGTHTIPLLFKNETAIDRETYAGSIAVLVDMFGPCREPEAEITRDHQDIAAGLQACLQTAMMHLLQAFQKKSGAKRLAMAGGVALNCTGNGVIKRSGLFDDMFIQPAAGDDGSALGAALYVQKQRQPSTSAPKMGMPYWGPDITKSRIEQALTEHPELSATHFDSEALLLNEVARLLNEGKIIGWCQGRMEFGPRALGARSIIADPRGKDMRARINSLVKKREDFRPFAPAIDAAQASTYFDINPGDTSLYEYMLCVTQVRPQYRELLPAITHVDGSARVQTVSEASGGRFYRLLQAFGAVSGLPMVLNTSFNVRGQPIVCNEHEAVETFISADLDALIVGDFVVSSANPGQE
ncbi:MAG: carbamoyltransferase [Burkholderiaceae bacterium]